MAKAPTDAVWLALVEGRREALEQLYQQHAGPLLRYGQSLTADAGLVADALHSLFVRLWERHARLPPDAHPRAYLLVSLRNELRKTNQLDQRLQDITSTEEHLADDATIDLLSLAEDEQQRKSQLAAAIATLSAREQEMINLRFLQELDYDNITTITGISYQSARNVLTRALGKLRAQLTTKILLALGTAATFCTLLAELPLRWPL